MENQFAKSKNRVFDDLKDAPALTSDFEPMFSSFNPKGVFIPPPTTKENFRKKRKSTTPQITDHFDSVR